MSIFYTNNIKEVSGFNSSSNQLAILKRKIPKDADLFFKKIMKSSLGIAGDVYKKTATNDIKKILVNEIPKKIQNDLFYETWINDMSDLCQTFCSIEKSKSVSFWISSQRGCRRYHVDNVPRRLLVTYAGQGTEWLPDEAVNRDAYTNGEPNKNILKDTSAKQFINKWDVAIFKGGPKGLLHRTPDTALSDRSILMRLDHAGFWKKIQKNIEQNKQTPTPPTHQ